MEGPVGNDDASTRQRGQKTARDSRIPTRPTNHSWTAFDGDRGIQGVAATAYIDSGASSTTGSPRRGLSHHQVYQHRELLTKPTNNISG